MPGWSTGGHDAKLTEQEIEAFKLYADGSTNREIAEALQMSVEDVERRLQGAFEKLGAGRRPEPPLRSA
jgi:DNA-binding NarL/FixJ family response regulator